MSNVELTIMELCLILRFSSDDVTYAEEGDNSSTIVYVLAGYFNPRHASIPPCKRKSDISIDVLFLKFKYFF